MLLSDIVLFLLTPCHVPSTQVSATSLHQSRGDDSPEQPFVNNLKLVLKNKKINYAKELIYLSDCFQDCDSTYSFKFCSANVLILKNPSENCFSAHQKRD